MSKELSRNITPLAAISFAVLLALIALFAFTVPRTEAQAWPLRVGLACSPLTDAQSYRDANGTLQLVKSGDPQTCRIKVQHRAGTPVLISGGDTTTTRDDVYEYPPAITGVTYTHPTPNNGVSLFATHRTAGGRVIADVACNQQTFTCAPVDLEFGESLLVVEQLQFDIGLDGRGRTAAYASGDWNGRTLTGYGTEQNSLP